jgi:hypothetical protein
LRWRGDERSMSPLGLESLFGELVLVLRVLMSWIPPGFLSRWYYESECYSNCFVRLMIGICRRYDGRLFLIQALSCRYGFIRGGSGLCREIITFLSGRKAGRAVRRGSCGPIKRTLRRGPQLSTVPLYIVFRPYSWLAPRWCGIILVVTGACHMKKWRG